MNCTRCRGAGFLNVESVPEDIMAEGPDAVLAWMTDKESDVTVCDCCGDGEAWYGEPGQHYGPNDPIGPNGPYGYNGGLCKCH